MRDERDILAEYLNIDKDRIEMVDDCLYEIDNQYQFIVADDEMANELVANSIKDSLWAFNTDFICDHCEKLRGANDKVIKSIERMQSELCEDANEIVAALIDDIDEFVEDAIEWDGRGHFLNTYDGNEYEYEDFYIYNLDCDIDLLKETEAER